jgi:hypothetical protein
MGLSPVMWTLELTPASWYCYLWRTKWDSLESMEKLWTIFSHTYWNNCHWWTDKTLLDWFWLDWKVRFMSFPFFWSSPRIPGWRILTGCQLVKGKAWCLESQCHKVRGRVVRFKLRDNSLIVSTPCCKYCCASPTDQNLWEWLDDLLLRYGPWRV